MDSILSTASGSLRTGLRPWAAPPPIPAPMERDVGRADPQWQRPARGDGPPGDRLLRAGAGRCGAERIPAGPPGAARLLHLGYHDDHVALPRVRCRRPRGLEHPAMVMGRAAALSCYRAERWAQ